MNGAYFVNCASLGWLVAVSNECGFNRVPSHSVYAQDWGVCVCLCFLLARLWVSVCVCLLPHVCVHLCSVYECVRACVKVSADVGRVDE